MRPWTRRYPIPAALVVGLGAYLFFGLTLIVAGDLEPREAWGLSTAIGAAVIAFISWAVFSRPQHDTNEHNDFDERARTWDDDPAKVERGRIVAESVRETLPLDRSTRVLEYGAGTGLAAQALAGDVGPITLADPSEGMRSVMTEKIAEGAFPSGTRVWDLDLTTDPVPDEPFDLVVTVMALHHIIELEPVLRGFAALLAGGGHLAIVDLEEDPGGSFHRSNPTFAGHDGFRRDDLATQMETAGFADIRFTHCLDVEKEGGTYPVFLATATRPPR